MTMRARAALLMLALMLSPLAAVACELQCSPSAASAAPRLSPHASSCHEGSGQGSRLQSQARHCTDLHQDGIGVRVETTSSSSIRVLHAAAIVVADALHSSTSTILIVSRPPGTGSVLRPLGSSLPLRI
jgi:hypothetical protein